MTLLHRTLVAQFNQWDQPDNNAAKMAISKWMATSDAGAWLRTRHRGLSYAIEADSRVEPYYWCSVYCELDPKDRTLYYLQFPEIDLD